jgi:uncharacterized membrane protein
MSDTIIVALISFAATVLANIGGYRLIAYRVERLEKTVERHNGVVNRTAVLEEKICVANHRIEDLENERKRVSA